MVRGRVGEEGGRSGIAEECVRGRVGREVEGVVGVGVREGRGEVSGLEEVIVSWCGGRVGCVSFGGWKFDLKRLRDFFFFDFEVTVLVVLCNVRFECGGRDCTMME